MKKAYLPSGILLFMLLQFLNSGCQKYDDDDVYDRSFTINDATFRNYSENYMYDGKNIIPANSYKIAVNLSTNNRYATEFGINPVQQNKIVGITIKTLLDLKDYAKKGANINELFLVQKGRDNHELYQTIETFLKKEKGMFERIDSGKFVFTNQDEISVKSNPIIQKNDTIPVKLYLKLLFDNELEISDTLNVTLFSN